MWRCIPRFVGLYAVLLWLSPRVHVPGELFKIFLAAYAVFRFAVEFVRGNQVVALNVTRPQWFLLATMPLFVWRFARQLRSGAYRSAAPPPAIVAAVTPGVPVG